MGYSYEDRDIEAPPVGACAACQAGRHWECAGDAGLPCDCDDTRDGDDRRIPLRGGAATSAQKG